MNEQILSIIITFAGSSINSISQAIQKIGLDTRRLKKRKGWAIWLLGSCLMAATPFIFMYATSLGGVSLVGAMSGTGLAALILFSHYVMKEEITANELAGVVMILGASVLIGIFSRGEAIESIIDLFLLYIYMAITVITYIVLTAISFKTGKMKGIVLGGFAGSLAGFITLFQKVTTSNPLNAASLFSNPFFYAWIVIGAVAFIILQFSYTKGRAIRIIPFFAANSIVIPVIGGVVCFKEYLNLFQWLGIFLIITGVYIKNTGKERA
ncbi:MAG: DMT family transporter [Candidatus Goldbacteria bacterium]|nr:DMT family transporter [Candidatus Goldiibacteriota bacterium]